MTRETVRGTRAHFHGTLRCASPFVCPVCSSALRIERAAEVVRCVSWWRSQGGRAELLTMTLRHGAGDDVGSLHKALMAGWRACTKGESWKRLAARLGIVYWIRGRDDTYGANGWHPHLHVVLLTKPGGGERQRALALRDLRARWMRCVERVLGPRHVPSWRGVDLRECENTEYVAKLGLEVVSPQSKEARGSSRTPWDIARNAASGDEDAVALWRSYTRAMKGARQLVWSRGLRKAAALHEEKSDQEIVDAVDNEAEETHVASIPARMWDDVARQPGAHFAILRAAEDHGRMGVASAIALYAWGLAPPDLGEQPDQLVLGLFNDIAPQQQPERQAQAASACL